MVRTSHLYHFRVLQVFTLKVCMYVPSGNNQMKVENFSAAIEFYSKAIQLNPQNAVYYCNRYLHNFIKHFFIILLRCNDTRHDLFVHYTIQYSHNTVKIF